MKVLLCHTYYQQRGGEDQSFEEERQLLRDHGHNVVEFVRHNGALDSEGAAALVATTLWNRRAAGEFERLVVETRPDVVHVTNTFPLISPAVIHRAHRHGVAVVQALRNYRLICPGAHLLRDGRPCHDCVSRSVPWPAVAHGCYRDSRPASAVTASMLVLHRALGTWRRKVDAFFTLTEFARQKFIEGGLPAERLHVKYNSVADPVLPVSERGDYFAFVGRLSPEKGVTTLLDAWKCDAELPPLKILGDGPLADAVRAAAASDARIEWLGQRDSAEVQRILSGAAALVMPSVWYETFGRTIAEAYASRTPVIASRLGAMRELVDEGRTGLCFAPGDAGDLARVVREFVALPVAKRQALGDAGRERYEARFTPEGNYRRLVEIYEVARKRASARVGSCAAAEVIRLTAVEAHT
jgi:glycosyltransferase involved in cell wall biosynthesis